MAATDVEDASPEMVLGLLRRLPPGKQLDVIASALPEVVRQVSEVSIDASVQEIAAAVAPLEAIIQRAGLSPAGCAGRIHRLNTLRGLRKDLGITLSAQDVDDARREAWANFPRDDL